MNYKIVETTGEFPDVLLHRGRDEDGDYEFVRIFAIGVIKDEEDLFASEIVRFENYTTAIRFIKDFSKSAASEWCIKKDIYYS